MKIRNKIVQILALAFIICYSYSCSDDFYTEQAGDKITPDKHFSSQSELNNSIKGTYSPLQKAYQNLLLIDGLRSDLLDVTENSDTYMREINDQIFSSDNPYIDASYYYQAIINCNEIIKNMDQVWIKDPTTDLQRPHLTKGVVYNIKAMCYFNIARLYGEAVLINDNLPTFVSTLPKLSKRDIIDTMINQLKPYVFIDSKLSEIKFDMGPNTKMLLGQLYLENDNYDSAAYYLRLGCESYKNDPLNFRVTNAYALNVWKEIFYKDNRGTENLDYIEFAEKKDQYNAFTGWTINYNVKPTQVLVDLYKNQIQAVGKKGDVYRGLGVSLDTLPGSTDKIYVAKYSFVATEPYSSKIITQRATDIHLQLAEAFNHLGDTAKALALVNNGIISMRPMPKGWVKWANNIGVRSRVGLKPRAVPTGLSGTAVTNAIDDIILDERMMELAYEGTRWFDLVRIAERRSDPSYLAKKVSAKFSDPNKQAEIESKLSDPAKWYLPVR